MWILVGIIWFLLCVYKLAVLVSAVYKPAFKWGRKEKESQHLLSD